VGRLLGGGLPQISSRRQFDFHMKTTVAAVPAIVFGVGTSVWGARSPSPSCCWYQRYNDRDPLEIRLPPDPTCVRLGSLATESSLQGQSPDAADHEQLDGIFAPTLVVGMGTSWHPEYAAGPNENIRSGAVGSHRRMG